MKDDLDETSGPELTADEEALVNEIPTLTDVGQARRTFLGQTLTGGMSLFALTLMEKDNQTLPVWLGTFKTAQGVDWGGLMAGSALVAIPVVVFSILLQGRIATGAAAGAVKG